ncbi:MAG: hypothetical protein GY749_15960 [Desulfobacteraceae bacterium]|nr:hypothetical protein [Desulfobacteraceae bacterium]MCP4344388.1 hypothetical protein [Desulfobacterales bacterium]
MEKKKTALMGQIEKVFHDIGGFTWEQAETWAGFCNAVGMDPLPFMKVMMNNICEVNITSDDRGVPSRVMSPELWVISKGFRTHFVVVEP